MTTMNNFTFTSTESQQRVTVPYFEDAKADYAPGYSTTKSVESLKSETLTEIVKLGGSGVLFTEGFFGDKPRRYGYVVTFQYGNTPARMQVAGLPMRAMTDAKKQKVLAHALFNLRDWLKAAVTARTFAPGTDVLMQYLLVDGQRTLAEAIMANQKLPILNPPLARDEVMEAVIVS